MKLTLGPHVVQIWSRPVFQEERNPRRGGGQTEEPLAVPAFVGAFEDCGRYDAVDGGAIVDL